MTRTRQPNPIFDRALQHSRWPSLQTTLIVFGFFILIGLVYTDYLYVEDPWDPRSEVIFGLFILLAAFLSAPLSALFTCLHLPSMMTSSDFQAIRLTGLSRRRIMSGFLLLSLYRLRLLWALLFSLWFALMLILNNDLGSVSIRGAHTIVMTSGFIGVSLNWLSISTGLWASVRWGGKGLALIVTLSITVLALFLVLVSLLFPLFLPIPIEWWWFPSLFTFTMSITLSVFLLHQAEQQI